MIDYDGNGIFFTMDKKKDLLRCGILLSEPAESQKCVFYARQYKCIQFKLCVEKKNLSAAILNFVLGEQKKKQCHVP